VAEVWDDDDRDPVIDAGLAEILGGERPPDLTERILAKLRTGEGLDAAALAATSTNGHPIAPAASPVKHSELSAPRRTWWQILATVAAVLLVGAGLGIAALYLSSPTDFKQRMAGPVRVIKIKPTPEQPKEESNNTVDEPKLVQDDSDSSVGSNQPTVPTPPAGDSETVVAIELPKPNWPSPIDEPQLLADINSEIRQGWQNNNLEPSSLADDEMWCRRVYVRLIGRIPTVDEIRRFNSDTSADKHTALVDRLNNGSEYADEYANHWATFWASVLIGPNQSNSSNLENREGLINYLRDAIRQNKPLDRLAYELISATGTAKPGEAEFNGAVNFLLANHSNDGTVETSAISRVFLGQRLQCVQCHDHPTNEALAQSSFWQFDALLRQIHVERKDQVVKLVDQDIPEEPVYYEELDGYKRAAYPVLPNGTSLPQSGRVKDVNRREILARYVSLSPQLAESVVNRTWSYFFGYGFTTPIDDLGPHNAPTHPQVLRELADQFAAHGFSHRHLTRWIALTDAFRLSSVRIEGNLADAPQFGGPAWFSRYYSREMQPAAISKSLQLVAEARQAGSDALPALLGQFNPTVPRDVHAPSAEQPKGILPFGPLVNRAVSSENGGVLRQVITSDMSAEEKIEHLFLAAVARKPQKNELDLALKMINDTGPEIALQDIWWALLNSSEFTVDH